jgi:ubiquinone/menaquinone biosynthesis C-methylase UbiE
MIAEFDLTANEYDSTRRPATEAEINAISRELRDCRAVLDIGVGTGRFAKPLSELGFEIVGVDLSRGMMSKAREKGIQNLVLADAHKLPFRDGAFDASILIHVLHLIPDWVNLVVEVGRVTRKRVISFLRNRGVGGTLPPGNRSPDDNRYAPSSSSTSPFLDLWQLYRQLREEEGYPVKASRFRGTRMWQNEEEIKQKIPPSKLQKISDELITMSLQDILARFEERRRGLFDSQVGVVSEDIHKQIISKMVSMLEERHKSVIERRVIEWIAVWKPEQFRMAVGV